MEYMAGCYRQREGSGSLLLQHYICGGVPVFLGCVCGGDDPGAGMAGGIFTGRLLGEFRSFRLGRAVKRPEKYLEKMEEAVYRHRESSFLRDGFYAVGILCIGEVFLSFSQDGAKIILCNTGFGRPVLSEIGAEDGTGLHFWRGTMESGIGILLAPDGFCKNIPMEDMAHCLDVKAIRDSGQAQKRVRELGCMAERRGGRNMAALLLEVR